MSILDLIDGAVEAWETSPDAMRWSAEPINENHLRPIDIVSNYLADAVRMMQADAELERFARDSQRAREEFAAYARRLERVRWAYLTPMVSRPVLTTADLLRIMPA